MTHQVFNYLLSNQPTTVIAAACQAANSKFMNREHSPTSDFTASLVSDKFSVVLRNDSVHGEPSDLVTLAKLAKTWLRTNSESHLLDDVHRPSVCCRYQATSLEAWVRIRAHLGVGRVNLYALLVDVDVVGGEVLGNGDRDPTAVRQGRDRLNHPLSKSPASGALSHHTYMIPSLGLWGL